MTDQNGNENENNPCLSQWYTPHPLAQRIVEWANIPDGAKVLEPSAGQGNLVKPTGRGQTWECHEIDDRNLPQLNAVAQEVNRGDRDHSISVVRGDFFAHDLSDYDVAILNPPYEHLQDILFLERCLEHAPRAVALARTCFLHGRKRYDRIWSQFNLSRMALIVTRPNFGGKFGPRGDYIVIEVRRQRKRDIENPKPRRPTVEWW